MPFRVCARNIFLTYPKCGLHQEIHDHWSKEAEATTALEQHEDGQPHVHAVLRYSTKQDIRNERRFDFQGFHPNIQGCKSLRHSLQYISKHGNVLGSTGDACRPSRHDALTDLLATSCDSSTFMAGFQRIDPARFIVNYQQLEYFAARRFGGKSDCVMRNRIEFKVPTPLDDWVNTNLFPSPERPKCLVLIGPTRLGKTEWARSLGVHTYWNNYVTAEVTPGARYAVVDDMENFDRFTGRKAMFGCQKIVGVNPKYSKLQQWEWGIPTIWLWNHDNKPFLNDYCMQNCTYIEISKNLY